MSTRMRVLPPTDTNTLQYAQRMARYGHKDWLWWHDQDGEHAARKTAENVKKMLLAVGVKRTKDRLWCLVMENDGCPMLGFWAMGINILNQCKRGYV